MTEENKPVRCGCGGEAIVLKCDQTSDVLRGYYVSCTKCTAGVGAYPTDAEAIEAWNRAMGERTAKVKRIDFGGSMLCDCDGECQECYKHVDSCWDYCPSCGAKLDWSGDEF